MDDRIEDVRNGINRGKSSKGLHVNRRNPEESWKYILPLYLVSSRLKFVHRSVTAINDVG